MKDNNRKTYIDYNIQSEKVRLVRPDGRVEIVYRDDAIDEANSQHMNLVQISYNPTMYPKSICKIMDYSKFKYEEKKRQKDQMKKQRAKMQQVKEIKFSIRTDDNDRNIKVNHIKQFLSENCLVKISIVLSKREMNRVDFAKQFMKDVLSNFDGIAKIEGTPSLERRVLSCMLRKST